MLRSKINDQISTSCFNGVGIVELNTNCSGNSIKHGKTKAGKQRYLCKCCGISFVRDAEQNGYEDKFDFQIVQLKNEGLGVRSTARVLSISPATVVRKILKVAANIRIPEIPGKLGRIQVDEVHTRAENNLALRTHYVNCQHAKQNIGCAPVLSFIQFKSVEEYMINGVTVPELKRVVKQNYDYRNSQNNHDDKKTYNLDPIIQMFNLW